MEVPSSRSSAKKKSIGVEMIEPTIVPISSAQSRNNISSMKDISSQEDSRAVSMYAPFTGAMKSHAKLTIVEEFDDEMDYDRFKKSIQDSHARTKFGKPYTCTEVCCQFHTGSHCLFNTSEESDLDKFGVGMVLYFRFLKFLLFFFLIFSVLSAPALYFTIKSNESLDVDGFQDYKGMLYFTTLGSLEQGVTKCVKASLNEEITLTCDRGGLGSFQTLEYGRIYNDESSTSCDLLTIFSWNRDCNNDDQTSVESSYASCQGSSSCTIRVDSSFFDSAKAGCASQIDSSARFYFRAYCQNDSINVTGGSSLSKKTIGYIIASIDAAICVIYFLMLFLLRGLQKKAVYNLEDSLNSVDGYTLKISNLPSSKHRAELKRELWKHFTQVEDREEKKVYNVVDVQLAESNTSLQLQLRMAALKKKKEGLYKKFAKNFGNKIEDKAKKLTYADIKALARQGNLRMLREFRAIRKLKEQQQKLKSQLKHENNQKKSQVLAAFVTFETREQRDDAFTRFQKSPFARFCYSFCSCSYEKDINIFHGSYLKVKDAPAPNNILWANLDVTQFEKFLRRLVSWIITVGFWAISFIFIVFAKSKQEDYSDTVKQTLDCSGYSNLSEQEVESDMARGSDAVGLLECYCRNISTLNFFVGGICQSWVNQRLITNALPFVVVAAVIITNYGLQYVFKLLSTFERHQSISSESTSRVIKIFVAQLLNTGVIILFVNARFTRNKVVNFLSGHYDDFVSNWYLNVGATLLTTMIINIVNLPLINSLSYFFRHCLRCSDRGCGFSEKSTRRANQEDWVKLYTGPEFLVDFRYAQILTVLFVCFIFCSGLPLLFLSTFLNLLFVYWMDKIFLLKFYQLPRPFDDKLENTVRKGLYLVLFFHLIIAVWSYGNPQVFGDESAYLKGVELVQKYQNHAFRYFLYSLWERARQSQNIALSILFAIFVVSVVADFFFRNTISRLAKFCFGRRTSRVLDAKKYQNQKTYYDYIRLEDLQVEAKYLQKELGETKDSELQELLHARWNRIMQEISKRDAFEENHLTKFLGVFSYLVWHNPLYKKFYNAETMSLTSV